jgi:hypothetical protein
MAREGARFGSAAFEQASRTITACESIFGTNNAR